MKKVARIPFFLALYPMLILGAAEEKKLSDLMNRYSSDRAMIQLLLRLGADPNKANKYGRKPFDK
ncbi:MAG: hypothetical protein WD055_03295 [Candidatus Dependentiae bacterium]